MSSSGVKYRVFGKALEHEANHGRIDESRTDGRTLRVIFAKAAEVSKPAKGTLDNPAYWQDNKALSGVRTLHNFAEAIPVLLHPRRKIGSGKATMGPQEFQVGQDGL